MLYREFLPLRYVSLLLLLFTQLTVNLYRIEYIYILFNILLLLYPGREPTDNFTSQQPLPWNKAPQMRSLDTSALALSPRSNLTSDPMSSHHRRGLMPLAPLAPLNSGL